MAVAYYGSHISEHLVKTPEGYLICYAVPINRTGTQVYSAGELGLDGDPERPVTVYRLEEDVFAPAALASLEGKDVTRGHPVEMLNAGNQASYSKGHLENVRRDGENTVADLIIKDPALVSDVENGVLREVSCGYSLTYASYPNAVDVTPKLTNSGYEQALQNGEFVLFADEGVVKVEQDINSLVTYTTDITKPYHKNRVIRLLNTIANDIYQQFSDGYIGVVDNNEQGHMMFKRAIVGYLLTIQANQGIKNFEAEDVTVEAGEDIDAIVVNLAIQPVDSAEKIYVTITVN